MSKAEIFYFSGTGNSLVVARDIAAKIGGKLTPIISVIDQDTISSEAGTVGIVFPVYGFKFPHIVEQFLRKFEDLGSKYIFAVGTYGTVPLKAMKKVGEVTKDCGGNLAAGFLVEMPHSGLGYPTSADKNQKLYAASAKKIELIAAYLEKQEKGLLETTNIPVHFILSGFIFKAFPSIIPIIWTVMRNGVDSLKFRSDSKCVGCGICKRICPTGNIDIIENNPSWSDDCVSCFACFHWCPQEAIHVGNITERMKRFHHPDVSISEMLFR